MGGLGGDGDGPNFSRQLVYGQTPRVPTMSLSEFCRQYRVSDKIRRQLDEQGFETAGSLFEVSDMTLHEAGLKSGHIAELKRALKEYMVRSAKQR
ncbi:hypothetical protein K438DRAFT_1855840 [Mycena galopus ATCC 62051]|nr:hypothetical protein K438DRAFT_1855840 [Mycena galopus ATCC 62051]